MPTAEAQSPQLDALGRSPEALPFWSRYGLPLRVMFPAANIRCDIAHGLGVIPNGYMVLWSDAPITATAGVPWTPTIAYLQSPIANARAIVVFLVLRENVVLTPDIVGVGGPPPIVIDNPIINNPIINNPVINGDITGDYTLINGTTTPVINSDTGTIHNWTPGLAGDTVIVWTGTADLTITGLAGGVEGQSVTIKNNSSQVIKCLYYDAGSVAVNRFLNVVTSGPTPVASGGWVTYQYVSGIWFLIAHEQGAWITPPFNAANFFGTAGGVWTVTAGAVENYRYRLSGRTLYASIGINNGTLSGAATSVIAANMPGGYQAAAPLMRGLCQTFTGSVFQVGAWYIGAGVGQGYFTLYPVQTYAVNGWVPGAMHIFGLSFAGEVL